MAFFLSSFNLGPAGLWEAVGGKGLLSFFPYGQNHDSSWLTVLHALQTTPAEKKKKVITLDWDNFKELRKTEEQET